MKTKLGIKILFGISIFCIIILILVFFAGFSDIIVKPLITNDEPQKSDVVIVLGGGVDKNIKDIGQAVQKRMDKGIELWLNGYADYIILTGGEVKDTSYAEADELIEYASEKDVPENIIFTESKARDTYENAVYSQEIMQDNNWQTALVATSDYHAKRACRIFRKLNMDVKCIAAEVPQEKFYQKFEYFKSILREYGATIYYWLRGRI